MKKAVSITLAALLLLALCAGCAGGEKKTLRVGASVTPHAEILAVAKDILADKGVELEIVEFTDYVQPNSNVENGQLDANFFQHQPYLDWFNENHGTDIVSVAAVHYEPMGNYAGKTASLDAIPDGARIAVPNDGTNEARALLLLEANGVITLKSGAGLEATKLDIAENPHNVEILEVEAAQIALSLRDIDLGVINGNYALQAGLNVLTDSLAYEAPDSAGAETYANVLCVKAGRENDELIAELVNALHSEKVRSFINDTYSGAVQPKF